jgi:hypothetical protein
MNWVPTFALLAAMMNDVTESDASSGASGVLRSVYLGLGIAPTPAPASTLLMADITEATYTGYARQPVVWFPPYIDVLGPETLEGISMLFRPTDAVTPNTITTLFIASAITAGTLLLTAACSPNVNLSDSTFALSAAPLFQLPFSQIYGRCLVHA